MLRTARIASVLLVLFELVHPPWAAEPTVPDAVLTTGPLPAVAPLWIGDDEAREVAFAPELDAAALWPAADQAFAWRPGESARFERTPVGPEGLNLAGGNGEEPWVAWVASYAHVDRFADVDVVAEGDGALRLFVDGVEAVAVGAPDAKATEARATASWRRGTHRLLVRVERSPGSSGPLVLRVEPAEEAVEIRMSTDPGHPPADYEAFREVAVPSGLMLSPDGRLLARVLETRTAAGSTFARLDVLDVEEPGARAAHLGGPDARAVAWRSDGGALLYRSGDSLFTWDRASGRVELVLADEPGLSGVSWAPDGSFVVVRSTRGVAEPEQGPVHRSDLREKLSDWPTTPHLHLVQLGSGVRRRLAVPGDWTQDSFEVLAGGRTLVTLRNIPIDHRPWFRTEVWTLDLVSGAERLVATLRMGFENRPGLSGMAASPDGRKIAFVGPPSELGDEVAVEPNAFDPDLFVLDLATGAWRNVTARFPPAADGHPHWTPDSSALWFQATEGSRQILVRADLTREEPPIEVTYPGGERIHDLALAGDGAFAAVVSNVDRLPWLVTRGAERGAVPRTIDTPNAQLGERWALPRPVEVPVVAEDGTPLEAWLFRPVEAARAAGKLPLIVYYYGGATPILRGWNELFAYLVGNGYALFVINPRGAHGYGRAFADHHVADWGDKAGADILRGVDAVLAVHDDLDPQRVGGFGGSYGGFMTLWLVAHSERFAAAVSLYGISNLASYWGDGMWGWTYGDQAMARKYPWSAPAWYAEHSPLYLADRIRTPLLLLHGEADGNVPPNESEQIFAALRTLGRPVELVRFPGEDHGLRGRWENRVAHREMLLDWFDRYLRDQPAAWEARWK